MMNVPEPNTASESRHPLEEEIEKIDKLEQFHYVVLKSFFHAAHKRESNNYDFSRFGTFESGKEMVFETDRHIVALNWYFQRIVKLFHSWNLLSDNASKALFIELLLFRLLGHLHVRIHADPLLLNDAVAEFKNRTKGVESTSEVSGMFGSLIDFDFEWNGEHYAATLSAGGLANKLIRRQYFFQRGNTTIAPEQGDHVIDGGACLGDTAIVFSHAVKEYGKVYSFEPNDVHLQVLRKNIRDHTIPNIELFPCGLSDREVETTPVKLKDSCDFGFSIESAGKAGLECPQIQLDALVESGKIERVDFIKLDIEGSELAALKGAVRTLGRFKPKLAISIYHKMDDLWEIIAFLNAACPFYRFYIDHYTIHLEETVLYASAPPQSSSDLDGVAT